MSHTLTIAKGEWRVLILGEIRGRRRKRVTLIAKSPENCADGQGSVSKRGRGVGGKFQGALKPRLAIFF